jgi:hypothetical protein
MIYFLGLAIMSPPFLAEFTLCYTKCLQDSTLAFDFGEGGNVGEESQKEDGENGMKAVADALSGARIVDLL